MSLYEDNKYRRRRVVVHHLPSLLAKKFQPSHLLSPPEAFSILHTSSIRMVCAGGNHSSARACCLGREEHEYTATNKGYEAAWLAASHKRSQILTSRYLVGTQLTGLYCHPERYRHHRRTEDTFPLPSSERERTNAACHFRIYPVSTIPELKTTDEPLDRYLLRITVSADEESTNYKENQFREVFKREEKLNERMFLRFFYICMIADILKKYQVHEFNYSIGNCSIVQSSSLAPRSVTRKRDVHSYSLEIQSINVIL